MAQPKLITFAISHYCEIARWALDWHGIDYREVSWAPGLHVLKGKRIGAKRGSVPMLIDGDNLVEGSANIVTWAGANNSGNSPDLSCDDTEGIERRLDKGIGINVRRLIYAHVLPEHAHIVKPLLFANMSAGQRLAGNFMWPMTTETDSEIVQDDRHGRE